MEIFEDFQMFGTQSTKFRQNVVEEFDSLQGKEIELIKNNNDNNNNNNNNNNIHGYKRSHDFINKSTDDDDYSSTSPKRLSTDTNFSDDTLKKSGYKNVNQKEASQRYRKNLKEKSKKIEHDLKLEEDKNLRLKKILMELENALGCLSKSLTKQTKIENFEQLVNAFYENGLQYAAANLSKNEIKTPKNSIASILVNDNQISLKQNIIQPKIVSNQITTPIIIDIDIDCEQNRFQELFMHNNNNNCQMKDNQHELLTGNEYLENIDLNIDSNFDLNIDTLLNNIPN